MSRYLDMVDDPSHVKKLTVPQLQQLAEEIRHELITKLAVHGGHLASNLGVVELTIALHYAFTTPVDKLVWDVSHQTYVHKLLTGRKDRFHTVRTTNGLSGFALRSESEHDSYGAGHAGTALSAALGMAAARDKLGGNEHVVSIFGDAALTNGISYEALNNIAVTTKKFIGILNDNEWSIAKNVGAIATYLNKLITHPSYNKLQKDFERWVLRLPKGELALRLGHKAEEAIKSAVTEVTLRQLPATEDTDGRGGYGSSLIFEEMGIRYLGPIDGHNLPLLITSLEFAKKCPQPVVVHIVTKKGKGFEAAQKYPEQFHGTGPFNIITGASAKPDKNAPPTYQDAFGRTMLKLCKRDSTLIGVTAAMPSGTGLKYIEKAMPQNYFDVGIAEEHAVLFAAGMAAMGFRPVCAIYSTFLQRAYDCIIHDVALQKLPVIFCMDRAGLSASDGPTHHGLYDVSFLRCVPDVIAMAPRNEDELADMLFTATHQEFPVFIRYPRGRAEGVAMKDQPRLIDIGKAEIVRAFSGDKKKRVTLIALGNMFSLAQDVTAQLDADEFDIALVNARFIKPLDEGAIEFYGDSSDAVVTLEDSTLPGGFGSAVLELFNEKGITTPVIRIGWPDQFIEHATRVGDLRKKYGLTAVDITERIHSAFEDRKHTLIAAVAGRI
ncbi:MAG: 1-deoxy-D-xylulose-5-phosphate synthase [Verrucomicrobia bacterium]|nr:1-deoxy-D-xylulose-5-phosphate synthase [Verrucomicrobiota bacterium]